MTNREKKVNVPVLFDGSGDCCGCESCYSACPKGAITMTDDLNGFAFPHIDTSLCVGCNACVRACGLHQRVGQKTSGPWYAAAGRGDVSRSASAGVFASLAREVLAKSGVVFGAAYETRSDGLYVRHCLVEDEEGLEALQNSKYVQSEAGPCFPEVRRQLISGRPVLFCGTPCQVAGLRAFLGKRSYPNLYTADLVCHGVPSGHMFRDWVMNLEKKYNGHITNVRFRSKRDGWGHLLLSLEFDDPEEPVYVPADASDYYQMFLGLETLRDSCYKCPYAGSFRSGDITLGDFWGVQENRPDVLERDGFDLHRGISCLLVNNAHGAEALDSFGGSLSLYEVCFDDIAKSNDQLRHPSFMPADRDKCLKVYREGGWERVSRWWFWHHIVPRNIMTGIKDILKKVLPTSTVKKLSNAR